MYKAQYLVSNEKGDNWYTCRSDSFVDQDGEYIEAYIELFKNKNDAIDIAKALHNLFGETVRVIKWNRTKLKWEQLKIKF